MTQSEILALRIDTLEFILALFGTFFTIVSTYIAGLFFFLRRAGFALKLLAFFLLSIGLAFLGGLAIGVTSIVEFSVTAGTIPVSPEENLRTWLSEIGSSFVWYQAGATLGWAVAALVYLALFYLTFFHRWNVAPAREPGGLPVAVSRPTSPPPSPAVDPHFASTANVSGAPPI